MLTSSLAWVWGQTICVACEARRWRMARWGSVGCRVISWRSYIKPCLFLESIIHKCWIAEWRLLPPHYTCTTERIGRAHLCWHVMNCAFQCAVLAVHRGGLIGNDVNEPLCANVCVVLKWSVHSHRYGVSQHRVSVGLPLGAVTSNPILNTCFPIDYIHRSAQCGHKDGW